MKGADPRQSAGAHGVSGATQVYDPEVGPPRGILRPMPPEGRLRHARRRPPVDLGPWIQHYWSVSWDLRDCEPFLQETLPHPNVYILFEPGLCGISGVHTARFSRTLTGKSHVFGIKFWPGGFRPFLGSSVGALADRVLPINEIFGEAAHKWQSDMLALQYEPAENDEAQIAAASAFLRARLPRPDPNVALATRLVEQIFQTSAEEVPITTADELARRNHMSLRTLQRLFQDYVGASPKWVIRRYRLHELVERLKTGDVVDTAQTALDLGYFDQAHLINDFRSIVGYSPTQYGSLLR